MRKKRSKILDAVHATARGLHTADAIDQVTMREFDQLCLKPLPPLRPAEIKRIRESANVSQRFSPNDERASGDAGVGHEQQQDRDGEIQSTCEQSGPTSRR
jgi:hypothetical protein